MKEVIVTLTEEEARMAYVAIVCWRAAQKKKAKKHPYFNSHNLKVLESAQEKIIKFKDEEIQKDLFNYILQEKNKEK